MTDLVGAFTPKAPPRGSRLVWAVVTQTSPLRVRIADEADPLNITPTTLVSDLAVSDVVRVEISPVGQAVILGRSGGIDMPDLSAIESAIDGLETATEFAFHRCIPTGVASSGSTATIDPATGVVSLPAGCTAVRLDGVLDPAWETRLVCRLEVQSGHQSNNSLWLRLAQAGTVNSNSGYEMAGQWRQFDGTSGIYATSSGNAAAVGPVSGASAYVRAHVELTLARAQTLNNFFFFFFRSFSQGSARGSEGGGYTPQVMSGEYDGVYLFPQGTSPVMQGEIYVETRRLN